MNNFAFDVPSYKKRLLIRTSLVIFSYLIFLIWNFLSVPADSRKDFLGIFIPLSIFLVFILIRNFRKQILLMTGARIEAGNGKIRQFSASGECLEMNLKRCNSIKRDVFRFFPRLTLEIDGVTHSLVNILNIDELQRIIETETKLTTEIVTVQKGELFKKALIYFIPSIVALIMVFIPRFPVDKKYFFLILNLNAVFFANSMPVEKFPGKRKLILILVFVFLMQLFLLIR